MGAGEGGTGETSREGGEGGLPSAVEWDVLLLHALAIAMHTISTKIRFLSTQLHLTPDRCEVNSGAPWSAGRAVADADGQAAGD